MSLPLRERGLKCNFRKVEFPCYSQSLPLRERGLKFCPAWSHQHSGNVAPLAGAWIEIISDFLFLSAYRVAPLAGAWIEISTLPPIASVSFVAPLAGAWIEIYVLDVTITLPIRRSPCGSVD